MGIEHIGEKYFLLAKTDRAAEGGLTLYTGQDCGDHVLHGPGAVDIQEGLRPSFVGRRNIAFSEHPDDLYLGIEDRVLQRRVVRFPRAEDAENPLQLHRPRPDRLMISL